MKEVDISVRHHITEMIRIKTSLTDKTSEEEIQTSSQRITRVSRTVARMTATSRDPRMAVKPRSTPEKQQHTCTVMTRHHSIMRCQMDCMMTHDSPLTYLPCVTCFTQTLQSAVAFTASHCKTTHTQTQMDTSPFGTETLSKAFSHRK